MIVSAHIPKRDGTFNVKTIKLKRRHKGKLLTTQEALDQRELFLCPHCQRIVPWEFGCDIGSDNGNVLDDWCALFRENGWPLPEVLEKLLTDDVVVREFCDECWWILVDSKKLDALRIT